MTWTRLDDTWCDAAPLRPLNLAARWHYLTMIQFCSRNADYDGVLRLADARRCSDVDDPVAALGDLIVAGLVENVDGATVRVVGIEHHVPPPSVRDAAAATKIRVSRHRKHKNGDHSECLPGKCPTTGNAPGNALPQDGQGQDRPGQEALPPQSLDNDDEEMWQEVLRLEREIESE